MGYLICEQSLQSADNLPPTSFFLPLQLHHQKRNSLTSGVSPKLELSSRSASQRNSLTKGTYQWSVSETRTLIQIHLSDEIDLKFQKTKKAHKHILVNGHGCETTAVFGDSCGPHTSPVKVPEIAAEYTKRDNKVSKSGADRTPLCQWHFYHGLEHSFSSCRQIAPTHIDCSKATPVRPRPDTSVRCGFFTLKPYLTTSSSGFISPLNSNYENLPSITLYSV